MTPVTPSNFKSIETLSFIKLHRFLVLNIEKIEHVLTFSNCNNGEPNVCSKSNIELYKNMFTILSKILNQLGEPATEQELQIYKNFPTSQKTPSTYISVSKFLILEN